MTDRQPTLNYIGLNTDPGSGVRLIVVHRQLRCNDINHVTEMAHKVRDA